MNESEKWGEWVERVDGRINSREMRISQVDGRKILAGRDKVDVWMGEMGLDGKEE